MNKKWRRTSLKMKTKKKENKGEVKTPSSIPPIEE